MVIWEQYVDYSQITFTYARRNQGLRQHMAYAEQICSFDIETTALRDIEQSVMYVWQFSIDNKTIIIGRTWSQFLHMIEEIKHKLNGLHLVVFVHNLSYEFAFLSGIYDFSPGEVFAVDSHKILRCDMYGSIEFRCSLKLTNMNLAAAANRYNKNYKKLSGESFDYSKQRFSDTPLTRKEILYCCYDVLAVVEMVKVIMSINNDTIYTLPLTSTGFVRRHVKNVMRPYHNLIERLYPDYRTFIFLRCAFRGGNTHGSRYYAGYTIDNMNSKDISSSYPHQQICEQFPMTPFKELADKRITHLEHLMEHHAALLIHLCIRDCNLINKYTAVPYLPFSKCMKWSRDVRLDNGRVLSANYVEFCCTDIDFNIIRNQYCGQYEIMDCFRSWYDFLPDPIRESNKEFYRLKTELKGVAGQELIYFKNKELLNSIYGMSVQNPVKLSLLYKDGTFTTDYSQTPEEILLKHKNRAFTVYQWGVWTTSHARNMLQAGIDICSDYLVYVDTDSCKYVCNDDVEKGFATLNERTRTLAESCGAYADDKNGKRHHTGIFEDDGHMQSFRTLGAKKYIYTDEQGKLHLTVSGVSKKAGAAEIMECGGVEAFTDGFVFKNSGKLAVKYQNTNQHIIYNGKELHITNNAYLYPVDYTLGITEEYGGLLEVSSKTLNKIMEFCINRQYTK